MAIAFRGFAAASRQLGGDPPVDLSGIGIQNNDFMVGIGRVGGGQTLTKPDGTWTTSPTQIATDAPFAWRKWVTGDATTWTWVASGASNAVVVIGVWSGVHTTSPVDDSDGITGTGALVIPSVDPAGTNRALVSLAAKLANTTMTFSGGGELWDAPSSTQNFVTAGAQELNIPNSATGTRTVTPAGGGTTLGVAYMLALRPDTVQHTVSSDLVGDGVVTRSFMVAVPRNLFGDGVLSSSKLVTASKSFDLVGDGVLTESEIASLSRSFDLVGDGVVTETQLLAAARTFDLLGDGVLDGSKAVDASKTFDLIGDGTVERTLDAVVPRDLTGDGTVSFDRDVAINKVFNLTGEGVLTELHPVTAARTFNLTGDGVVGATLTFDYTQVPAGDCPSDWSPNDGLKAIAGQVLFHEPPNQGTPVVGATVTLVRDSDGLKIATATTDGTGNYSFPRDTNDPNTYHVEVNYIDGGGKQQGLSEGGCVPQ